MPVLAQHDEHHDQEEERQRDADEMGVEIGEEEAPIRELVDGEGQHPARSPEVVHGIRLPGAHCPAHAGRRITVVTPGRLLLTSVVPSTAKPCTNLGEAVQVADDDHEERPEQGGQQTGAPTHRRHRRVRHHAWAE
ncbi:MAG: hypothetical protein R3A10_20680 [Caldilineaceae bacterium]